MGTDRAKRAILVVEQLIFSYNNSVKTKIVLLLGFIVLLAGFLRFFNITKVPPSLTWDEVSWGYNAYSLGIDGKDEFGRFLPLTYLESFGDFKPPVYAYLTVLPVKLFGLNEFSTRFASAFFGTLTVLLAFFLVRKIFPQTSSTLALASAGVLAISPWHILLSRAAFEANVATFFIVLGVYLFLVSLERRWFIVLSVLSFVVSMYTFNTARIVSPLLLLGLVFANRKYILEKMRKEFVVAAVAGAIIFLPLFLFLLTPQAKLRFAEVNIFSDATVVERSNQQIANDHGAEWSKVLHNRRLGYAIEYLKHYFDNLTPEFLFIKGDGNPKFSIQDVGQMYIWEIPFFIVGILFLFRKRDGHWWIIPYWLIVGIIPAATARETPHALRIETTLPTFQILTAIGIYYVFKFVSSIKYQVLSINTGKLLATCYILLATFNISYFFHNYFVYYPKTYSAEWQYGYRETIAFTKQNEGKFDKIIFTEDLGRPYIYALFYEKYNPQKFREEAKVDREALGFVHVRAFGKYRFVKGVLDNLARNQNNLYIDKPNRVPKDAKILATFTQLDGVSILAAYTL